MKNIFAFAVVHFYLYTLGLILITPTVSANETKPRPSAIQNAVISTSMGEIHIELYAGDAPISASNFIRYIKAGAFNNGRFYRVVRLDNDNGAPKIEVIQGGANPEFKDFAAIELETTQHTGIQHLDGVLSMARGTPDSATSEFFICVAAQPSLDFGGTRNPDGQGFAAFGRVTKGMPIVRKIHQIQDALEVEDNYVKGQMLAQPVTISKIRLVN
ncbi:MAG: peptidylprolyl isomerase [Paraglaciecola sp.]|uniref:peptidylprolyl isomerase n=1 Tax=Paraglaciecola sp. TaxID=1920173 RepID=UPI0032992E9E